MENASDAIIMAGAMLIFVLAITVAMTVFSQARSTVDTVLYASDPTSYYEYLDTENNNVKNRIVGLETIIPTLYKYYKENYTVVFLDEGGNGLPIYTTKTNPLLWSGNDSQTARNIPPIINKYPGMNQGTKTTNIKVCSFDVDEETKRHEPWVGSTIDYKTNIDAFLQGGIFEYPNGSGDWYDYSKMWRKGFAEQFKDRKFRETIGEYSIKVKEDNLTSELDQGIRNNKNKRVIIYQLLAKD